MKTSDENKDTDNTENKNIAFNIGCGPIIIVIILCVTATEIVKLCLANG